MTKTASLRVLRISENSIIRLNPPSFVRPDSRKYACECRPKNISWVPLEKISMSTMHISPSKNVSGRSKYTKPIILSPEDFKQIPIQLTCETCVCNVQTSLKNLPLLKFNDTSNPSNHHANLFPCQSLFLSFHIPLFWSYHPNQPFQRFIKPSNCPASKAGVLETASKLRRMKSMPARGKSRPLRRRPKTPRFRGLQKLPAGFGLQNASQVWGKSSYTNSSTEKLLVGVDGCKSGKKPVEVGSISHWFRGFCTSQVVSWSSSINSTRLKADIQNPQHPNQQTPSNPTTKTLKRSV